MTSRVPWFAKQVRTPSPLQSSHTSSTCIELCPNEDLSSLGQWEAQLKQAETNTKKRKPWEHTGSSSWRSAGGCGQKRQNERPLQTCVFNSLSDFFSHLSFAPSVLADAQTGFPLPVIYNIKRLPELHGEVFHPGSKPRFNTESWAVCLCPSNSGYPFFRTPYTMPQVKFLGPHQIHQRWG